MSISSVKTGAVGVSLLAGNTAYDPAATWLIQRITPANGTSSITFSSIPQTYQHLQIRFISRDTNAGTLLRVQGTINSDTSSVYTYHRLEGDGSGVFANASITETGLWMPWSAGASTGAGTFGSGIMDIHDYTSTTKFKTCRMFSGTDANGSGRVQLMSYLWRSTSAITNLSFSAVAGFAAGTTFALYGMVG